MSRESSKSMKIGLKFEWEIEPRERFAQNPPKFVSIRRAGLTMFWECQAGAPRGHCCCSELAMVAAVICSRNQ